jgi:hypothetical protein
VKPREVRFRRLLDRGFYPQELPPNFRTQNFGHAMATKSAIHPNPTKYWSQLIYFDGTTYQGSVRSFGIINPISYAILSDFISENWPQITNVFKLSTSSSNVPKFPRKVADLGRAFTSSTVSAKKLTQERLASGFPLILNLDISRFYGSIYTHTIPWSALGKEKAKSLFNAKKLSGEWSDSLDLFVRNCNERQTVGIPIGPDTSRIISEMILSRLDHGVSTSGKKIAAGQFIHGIDDYQFGAMGQVEVEEIQAKFSLELRELELRANDRKTSVSSGMAFAPVHWEHGFDDLVGSKGPALIERFFSLLYRTMNEHPNSNVAGYSLKKFATALAKSPSKDLVLQYLQRFLFAAPHLARWVLPIFLGLTSVVGITKDSKRLLDWGIEICCRRGDVANSLWFLYARIFLKIGLSLKQSEDSFKLSSPLIDLTLEHMRVLGLNSMSPLKVRKRYKSSALKEKGWLVLYEMQAKGWDTSTPFDAIGGVSDHDMLFLHLKSESVSFYDESIPTLASFRDWKFSVDDFSSVDSTVFETMLAKFAKSLPISSMYFEGYE